MNGDPVGPGEAVEIDPKHSQATEQGGNPFQAVRDRKLEQIPLRQRPVFRRAWGGQSRKAAMRAFCLECMGYESAEVSRCTAPACPLFEYREDRL